MADALPFQGEPAANQPTHPTVQLYLAQIMQLALIATEQAKSREQCVRQKVYSTVTMLFAHTYAAESVCCQNPEIEARAINQARQELGLPEFNEIQDVRRFFAGLYKPMIPQLQQAEMLSRNISAPTPQVTR